MQVGQGRDHCQTCTWFFEVCPAKGVSPRPPRLSSQSELAPTRHTSAATTLPWSPGIRIRK